MSNYTVLNKKTTKQLLEILIYEKSKFEKDVFLEVKRIYKSIGVLRPEENVLRKQLIKDRRSAVRGSSEKN